MNTYDVKIGFYKMGLEYQVYRDTAQIPSSCNSIIFKNQGTANVVLDDMVIILPGQVFSISGNAGEILERSFNTIFTGAGTKELVVISKVYL